MVTGSAPAPVAEAELDVSPTDPMAILTHVLFDFFGTLVAYSESRVEQGFQRSYEVLVTAGTQVDYSGFLERWSGTFEEFEMRAQHSLDEYSMNDVCEKFRQQVLPQPPDPDVIARFRDAYDLRKLY